MNSSTMCRESLIDFSKYEPLENGNIISKFKKSEITNKNKCGKRLEYVTNTLVKTNGERESFQRHRVIWYYFKGDIPEGLQVCHWDSNPENNSLDNLYLGTPKDNMNNPITRKRMEKVWNDPTRNEKIRLGNIGRAVSQEQKDKQSRAMSGENHPFWGKKRPKQSQIMNEKKRDSLGRWIK